jgi:hypothetical protein
VVLLHVSRSRDFNPLLRSHTLARISVLRYGIRVVCSVLVVAIR